MRSASFWALKKPTLLIPLSAKASRGDQILNARSFERQGFSMVLEEEELTTESLLHAVSELNAHRADYIMPWKHPRSPMPLERSYSFLRKLPLKVTSFYVSIWVRSLYRFRSHALPRLFHLLISSGF